MADKFQLIIQSEDGRWCNNGLPSLAGARREQLRDAFLAGLSKGEEIGRLIGRIEALRECNPYVEIVEDGGNDFDIKRAEANLRALLGEE